VDGGEELRASLSYRVAMRLKSFSRLKAALDDVAPLVGALVEAVKGYSVDLFGMTGFAATG